MVQSLVGNRVLMMSRAALALAILALLGIAPGCRKTDTITTPPDAVATVTTTIVGHVMDDAGNSLVGVTITSHGKSTTTAAGGLFVFPNISVPASRMFVIASKSGYFTGGKASIPSGGRVTYLQLSLASSTVIGTVDAVTGGTVSLPTGGSIGIASNGVITFSGSPYSGAVSISARHVAPTDTNFTNLFAGDLTGLAANGKQTILTSAGIILAELHGSGGELLQPAPGKPATLTMPIVASQQSTAPVLLPLWSFDESIGMWKEEGSAAKVGNTYTGTVQHFTIWNCDWGGPWGTIKGRILCNGAPIPGVVVNTNTSGQHPISDDQGYFQARVPAIANGIEIRVLASENGRTYFMTAPHPVSVAPDVTTDLGDFSLDSPCPCHLTGKLLDCNRKMVPGMVQASWSGGMSYVYSTDGTYDLVVGSNLQVTVAGTSAAGDAIQPQSLASTGPETKVILDLSTCVDQTSDVLIDIPGTYSGEMLALSSDGSKIAVVAKNEKDVVIFDTKTGKSIGQLTNAFHGTIVDTMRQYLVKFSPDGSTIVTSHAYYYLGAGFDCWKSDGTRLTPKSINTSSPTVCFSPSGNALYYFYIDSSQITFRPEIAEYDIASNTISKTYSTNEEYASVVGLAAGGTQFIVTGDSPSGDLELVRWDMSTDKQVSSFRLTDSASYWAITFGSTKTSTDGSVLGIGYLYSQYFYNTSTGMRLNAGRIVPTFAGSYELSPDGNTFIGQYRAGVGNTVGMYSTTDGTSVHIFDPPFNSGYSSGVALSSDGKVAAAVYDNVIRIWKVK